MRTQTIAVACTCVSIMVLVALAVGGYVYYSWDVAEQKKIAQAAKVKPKEKATEVPDGKPDAKAAAKASAEIELKRLQEEARADVRKQDRDQRMREEQEQRMERDRPRQSEPAPLADTAEALIEKARELIGAGVKSEKGFSLETAAITNRRAAEALLVKSLSLCEKTKDQQILKAKTYYRLSLLRGQIAGNPLVDQESLFHFTKIMREQGIDQGTNENAQIRADIFRDHSMLIRQYVVRSLSLR
jgi:hypothetical protein